MKATIENNYRKHRLATGICLAGLALSSMPSFAQEDKPVEEVIVTGSFVQRQTDFSQPVQIINSTEIQMQQSNTLSEMFKVMPQAVAGVSTANSQEGGGNTPTATINLRGLGNRSTLVLLNGRRQTIDGSGTGVDVNNLTPAIMIERVEMLLDGASAIYGSDAVAGVVNYITRNNFQGTEVRVDTQRIQASPYDRPDYTVSFITGAQGEDSGVVAAIEYRKTNLLLAEDLWDERRLRNTTPSSFANPGSFVPGTTGSTVAGRRPDPLCGDPRLSGQSGLGAGFVSGTACSMVASLGRTMMPATEAWNGLAVAHQDFANDISFNFELGFAQTENTIPFGYVTPLLTPLPVIPANNPGVIAANKADPNFKIQPYRWWGRFLSPTDGKTGAIHRSGQNTFRVSLGLDGPLMDTGWRWDVDAWMGRSRTFFTNNDVISDRFLSAVEGYGGQECTYSAANDPTGQYRGANEVGCYWFNPFANHSLASPGDPAYNDPELLDFVVGKRRNDGDAELRAFEAKLVGEGFEMAGGATAMAIGYQRREQDFAQGWDELTRQGFDPVTGTGYRFNQQPIPDFNGTRNTDALFAEVVMYPVEGVEVQLAARREKFARATSTDPKVGVIWNAAQGLTLRGTYGTSFRMPTEDQLFGRSPGGSSTIPIGGEGINARGVTLGNDQLQPETSENWTVGFTWDVNDSIQVSMDYWNVYFENLVTGENAQGLLEADMADGKLDNPKIQLFAGSPTEVCEVTGRYNPAAGGPAPAGCVTGVDIATIVTSYINQSYRETAGLDFQVGYDFEAFDSEWSLRFTGVYTNKFEISEDGRVAEEQVGGNTFAKMRSNLSLDWRKGDYFARAMFRYISALGDPNSVQPGQIFESKAFKTLDLVGGTSLPWLNANLTVSVLNVLGEEDPIRFGTLLPVASNIYDWRQRVFRLGLSTSF